MSWDVTPPATFDSEDAWQQWADGLGVEWPGQEGERMQDQASATKRGGMDGLVAASLDRCDCDARGAFIKRPELDEAQWPEYKAAYNEAFDRAIAIDKALRRAVSR